MSAFAVSSAVSPAAAVVDSKAAFVPVDVAQTLKSKRTVAFSELKSTGPFPLSLRLHGALTTNGVNVQEHEEWGAKWSFGMSLYEQADVEALLRWTSAEELQKAFVLPADLPAADIATTELLKNGVLYLKTPVSKDGKTFTNTSNLKMTPKKPSTDLFQQMPVDAYVNVVAYMSLPKGDEPAKWGLSLKVKHVDFWTDPAMMNPTPTAPTSPSASPSTATPAAAPPTTTVP